MAILAVVTELFGYFALRRYPGAGFTLSLSLLVTVIAMIRWGVWGSLVYLASNIALLAVHVGEKPLPFLILFYPVAGLFVAAAALAFLVKPRNGIKADKLWFVLFQAGIFILAALGRGIATLIYGEGFLNGVISFWLNNTFSMVATVIISLFLLKRDGLITDMTVFDPVSAEPEEPLG